MTDPWLAQNIVKDNESTVEQSEVASGTTETRLEFEDNFAPSSVKNQQTQNNGKANTEHHALPDSASYLQGLERKLQKIKKGTALVEALTEKRQDCLRNLLQEDSAAQCAESVINNNAILELDAPISNGESTVQEIYRHLQPVQPVTVGELVHIVKYDQLEEQQQQQQQKAEAATDENTAKPESH